MGDGGEIREHFGLGRAFREAGSPNSLTVTIDNWTGIPSTQGTAATDRLIFQTSQPLANLNDFVFSGYSGSITQFNLGGGFYEMVPVPEPSTWAIGLLGMSSVIYSTRRKLRALLRARRRF